MKMNEKTTLKMEDRAEQLNAILLAQEADFTVDYVKVWKNNTELEGYTLKSSNNCAPTIYFDEKWYQKSDREVVEFLTKMHEAHDCKVDVAEMVNRDYILSHIMPRMVSAENGEELENRGIAHIKFLDMFILFYAAIDNFAEDGMASLQITDNLLKMADISIDEAYKYSLENLESQVEIKTMEEILFGEMGMDASELGEPQFALWVCTTKNKLQGAAAMLCPSVLKKLEERIGGKIAILPSSIHEFIALGYNTEDEFETLLSMVREVNATQVAVEERLTDSVYYVQNQQLKIAM